MAKVLQTKRENTLFYLGKWTDAPDKRYGILTIEYTRSCTRQR